MDKMHELDGGKIQAFDSLHEISGRIAHRCTFYDHGFVLQAPKRFTNRRGVSPDLYPGNWS